MKLRHKTNTRDRNRNRRGQDGGVPMTPMIDVVFQMLIYFVLTFEIPDRLSMMPVWRPRGPGPGGEINMRIGVQRGVYTLDERVVSLQELEKVFNRLADLNPQQYMMVLPSVGSRHEELVTLLNLINKSGLENVSLVSTD